MKPSGTPPVKSEVEEDELEDQHVHGPLHKRSKTTAVPEQNDSGNDSSIAVSPLQYNPLDEPSPLVLRLRKTPSLLELIQMRLSQPSNPNPGGAQRKKEHRVGGGAGAASGSSDSKLKASNFPASFLKIGTWEYKSRYEGDLVAKCYFAKHKLVWEVLDGGLKNKIEIQWSDIIGFKAVYPDDEPGTLNVVLVRQPLFFRETNPQPRKHTLWQATTDFTGGQASTNRRHYLQCPPGLLGKHFEKLIQCDHRLNYLSKQAEISLESPYFESRDPIFDKLDDVRNEFDINIATGPAIFDLRDEVSTSGTRSSFSKNEHDFVGRHPDQFRESPSPSSVIDSSVIENIKNNGMEELKNLSCWDRIRVPGLHHSMSINDLVSHLENQILEPSISNSPILSDDQRKSLEILEEISRCLFTDSRHTITSDEKSVLSRVNSLCCLLQRNPSTVQEVPLDRGNYTNTTSEDNKDIHEVNRSETKLKSKVAEESPTQHSELKDGSGYKQESGMSRKDSVGDLLLNLPRIASLPHFCFNFSDDFDNQSR